MRPLVVFTFAALAAWGAAEDTYYGIYLQEKKVGYAVSSMTTDRLNGKRVNKGSWREVVAGSVLLGTTNMEILQATWSDDYGNTLKEMTSTTSAGRTVTVTAVHKGRKIEVVMDSSGTKTKKVLTLRPGQQLETDPLGQVKAGGAKVGKSIVVYSLDDETLTLKPETIVYRGKSKTAVRNVPMVVEKIDLVTSQSSSSLCYDEDGEILNGEGPYGSQLIREPKAIALAKFQDPKIDVYAASKIGTDKELPNPAHLDRFTSRLETPKWQDLKLPSDEHQTVTKADTGWEIDVHPIRLDLNSPITIADSQTGKEEWLKPDLNIPSDTAEFKNLATKILAGERRVTPAMLRVKDFVFQTMHPKDGIGVLRNASEILKTKEGVCRDYAILAITIMRAAGIPSKLTTGLVNWDDGFYYHEWIQAWDGKQWVGLDAMVGDEQLCASHIELASGTYEQAYNYPALDKASLKVLLTHYPDGTAVTGGVAAKPTPEEIGLGEVNAQAKAALDRGDSLKAAKKYDEAEKAYREAMNLDRTSASPYGALSTLFFDQSLWQKSAAVCRAALQRWPKNYELLYDLGYDLMQLDRNTDSELILLEGRKYDPDQNRYAPILAYVYYALGKYSEAVTEYRQVIKDNPKDADAHASLSDTLFFTGKSDEAAEEANLALKLDPNIAQPNLTIGAMLAAKGKFAEAEPYMRKYLELMKKSDPKDSYRIAYGHANLAAVLVKLNRRAEAVTEAKEAKRLGLTDHPVYQMLGMKTS